MSGRSWSRVQQRLCTAINKAACMRRWTNSAVISLLLHMVGSGRARKTSEVSYWHNTYKLARSHEVCIEKKALTVRRSAKSCRVAPPSTRTHRPEGARAGAVQQTAVWGAQQKHSSVCKQEHICFQHGAPEKNIVARKLDWSVIKVRVGARSLSPLSAGVNQIFETSASEEEGALFIVSVVMFYMIFPTELSKNLNIYWSLLV